MKQFINKNALEATQFSATKVGPLASLIHKMDGEGTYNLEIYEGKSLILKSEIVCSKEYKNNSDTIDFSKLVGTKEVKRVRLSHENSFIAFHNSKDFSAYKVLIKKEGKIVFDSAKPSIGDYYTLNILRPGVYECTSKSLKSSLRINVEYPSFENFSTKRFKESQQISSEIISGKKELNILPNQGMVVLFDNKFNDVTIALKKENVAPKGKSIRDQIKLQARKTIKKKAKKNKQIIRKYKWTKA